jgi:hypothetical protein
MTDTPPYSADQLRQMAGETLLAPLGKSVFDQLAWITGALVESERKAEDSTVQAAQQMARDAESHAAALEACEAELACGRELSGKYQQQAREASLRAENAEKERDELRAELDATAKERDEAAAALLTGETDPETGASVSWKEKADQWNFAFIMAKRRAERAEAERDAAASRLNATGIPEGTDAEGRIISDGSTRPRRLGLAQT